LFSFIISYIKSLIKPTDISLTLNGSQITFTKEGDIKLLASRNLDIRGKYIFENCTDNEIEAELYKEPSCLEQLEEEIL
jgi:hypothetical protein